MESTCLVTVFNCYVCQEENLDGECKAMKVYSNPLRVMMNSTDEMVVSLKFGGTMLICMCGMHT